jgi:hypothetical protein
VYSIYLSYFFESVIYIKFSCIRTKVFYMILIESDSHRTYLYSLHVPNLLSVSETIFPSLEVKKLERHLTHLGRTESINWTSQVTEHSSCYGT